MPKQRRKKIYTKISNLNEKIVRVPPKKTKKCEVYFQDIQSIYIENIQSTKYCVGCVAWLRDPKILQCLSLKDGCSFIVNNEKIPGQIKLEYLKLKPFLNQSIKYIGQKKKKFSAILHHKFLIGLDNNKKCEFVITGSYNLSNNAANNLENIVILKEQKIINSFFHEFMAIWNAC